MRGLLFIPDISGFTNFVKNIDIDLGVSITMDLLNAIIDSSPKGLELSEIEGDAVLFYKTGAPLSLDEVFAGFKNMYEAFDARYQELKEQYRFEADLSLKVIVHYGDLSVYQVKGFRKLYGQTVIETHRLLKNGSDSSSYVLVTDDYMKALELSDLELMLSDWAHTSYKVQSYNDLRTIGFYYFHYCPTLGLGHGLCKDREQGLDLLTVDR